MIRIRTYLFKGRRYESASKDELLRKMGFTVIQKHLAMIVELKRRKK